jgi:predicted metal-dependent hydrolase
LSSLARGIDLFNEHRFWEAHEAWEAMWLKAAGEEKTFLQGLIQLAAAYHHVQRGTVRGGARLFEAALAKLDRFPAGYSGVDRATAVDSARKIRSRILAGDPVSVPESAKLTLVTT